MIIYCLDSSAWVKRYFQDIAFNQSLRGADSVHLASALVLQKRLVHNNQLIFVASDLELKIASNTFNILTDISQICF